MQDHFRFPLVIAHDGLDSELGAVRRQFLERLEPEAAGGGEMLGEVLRPTPVHGVVVADDVALLVAVDDVDDEKAAGLQHPPHLGEDLREIEGVVQAVGVDAVDRSVGELQGVEVAGHDVRIFGARIQVDADGEIPEADQRLDFLAPPRGQADHRGTGGHAVDQLKATTESADRLLSARECPPLHQVEFLALMRDLVLTARVVARRHRTVVLPCIALEGDAVDLVLARDDRPGAARPLAHERQKLSPAMGRENQDELRRVLPYDLQGAADGMT